MVTHIVLFKLIDPTPENLRQTVNILMDMKGKIPQIRGIEVGTDQLHLDRSYDIGLIVRFDSLEDLKIYTDHPVHRKVVEFMNGVRKSSVCVDFTS